MRRPGGDSHEGGGCTDVRRWLQVFLDDEIEDRTIIVRLAEHLDLCQKCRREAKTFSELKNCLRRLQPPEDPAAVRRLQVFIMGLEDPHSGETL